MVGDRAVAILKTDDMAETIRWYLAAGFQLRDQFPGGDPTWCELARDGLVLQFLAGETPWPGTPTMTGLYLYPTSVVAVHEELRDVIDLEWGIEPERVFPHVRRGHQRRADVSRFGSSLGRCLGRRLSLHSGDGDGPSSV